MLSRRTFLASCAGAVAASSLPPHARPGGAGPALDLAAIDRARILHAANRYLREAPITITSFSSPRSAGGRHDYFSEGDYWWPDPANPGGPYVQRDGFSNPDNFTAHRTALIRLSQHVPALAAAWSVTREERYAARAVKHLRAWFVDEATRMNPNLQYAQAIHGRTTGRGIGIIDTLHLVEVARAVTALSRSRALDAATFGDVKSWFTGYVNWMTTSANGIEEREAKNNHGTCWVLQVAEFARLAGNTELMSFARDRMATVIMLGQIAPDGSFPQELRRTKPYGYCLFNLDAMATGCHILATPARNLWTLETSDGRGMKRAMDYMFPFIADKSKWPLQPDVEHFDNWPVRHPALLFAGIALQRPEYVALWRKLEPDPTVPEIIRNFPIRQPLLWMNAA